MSDLAGAQILRLGRKAEKRIDLALGEQLGWLRRWAGDPIDVLGRVESDLRRHDAEEGVPGRAAERRDPDALPFQIDDAADAIIAEQLEAAGMEPTQNCEGRPAIGANYRGGRKK